MKKLLFVVTVILLIGGVALFVRSRLLKEKQNAGLQVISEPKATVFLEGRHLGQTPFDGKELSSGEFLLKLVPESEAFNPWEQKIKLNPGILTVVKHEFAEGQEYESSEVLTLEPLANKKLISLAIISSPDGALIKVDGITRTFAPISLEDISEGEHLISLSLPGYLEKEIKAKTILGRKLIVNVKLAKEKIETEEASPSAEEKEPPYVEIGKTPTGWLRVRLEPTTMATEAAKVKPGEKYPLLDEEKGWYKIRYDEEKEGWISGQYATKQE